MKNKEKQSKLSLFDEKDANEQDRDISLKSPQKNPNENNEALLLIHKAANSLIGYVFDYLENYNNLPSVVVENTSLNNIHTNLPKLTGLLLLTSILLSQDTCSDVSKALIRHIYDEFNSVFNQLGFNKTKLVEYAHRWDYPADKLSNVDAITLWLAMRGKGTLTEHPAIKYTTARTLQLANGFEEALVNKETNTQDLASEKEKWLKQLDEYENIEILSDVLRIIKATIEDANSFIKLASCSKMVEHFKFYMKYSLLNIRNITMEVSSNNNKAQPSLSNIFNAVTSTTQVASEEAGEVLNAIRSQDDFWFIIETLVVLSRAIPETSLYCQALEELCKQSHLDNTTINRQAFIHHAKELLPLLLDHIPADATKALNADEDPLKIIAHLHQYYRYPTKVTAHQLSLPRDSLLAYCQYALNVEQSIGLRKYSDSVSEILDAMHDFIIHLTNSTANKSKVFFADYLGCLDKEAQDTLLQGLINPNASIIPDKNNPHLPILNNIGKLFLAESIPPFKTSISNTLVNTSNAVQTLKEDLLSAAESLDAKLDDFSNEQLTLIPLFELLLKETVSIEELVRIKIAIKKIEISITPLSSEIFSPPSNNILEAISGQQLVIKALCNGLNNAIKEGWIINQKTLKQIPIAIEDNVDITTAFDSLEAVEKSIEDFISTISVAYTEKNEAAIDAFFSYYYEKDITAFERNVLHNILASLFKAMCGTKTHEHLNNCSGDYPYLAAFSSSPQLLNTFKFVLEKRCYQNQTDLSVKEVINHRSEDDGETILHIAACKAKKNPALIEYLLQQGARSVENNQEETPYILATEIGELDESDPLAAQLLKSEENDAENDVQTANSYSPPLALTLTSDKENAPQKGESAPDNPKFCS